MGIGYGNWGVCSAQGVKMNTQEILNKLNNDEFFGRDLGKIYQKNKLEQAAMRHYAAQHNFDPTGIDHYHHRKTMYETAQKGQEAANLMLILGALKESRDLIRRDTAKLGSVGQAWSESKKDLQNNILGYIIGLNTDLSVKDNPELNQYNSNTVNTILEALKGQQ